MRILELFCGTKSVSKAALACGYASVVSVDVNKRCSPTICVDILDFEYKMYPVGFFHFVWASPPCTEFSRAKTVGVRKIAEATRIVEKTLEIIKYLQPAYFCIENPVGLLRLQPCMAVYERYLKTVSYCRYGFQYRKNTNLWTNVEFDPQKCVKGSLCKTKEKTGYHAALCQSSHNGKVRGRPDSVRANKPQLVSSLDERYSIPLQLLTEIFKKTKKRVFFKVSKKVHFSPPVDTMQSGFKNALLEAACDDANNELPEVQKYAQREKPVTMRRLKLDDALKQRAASDFTAGWSEARIKAWNGRERNENAYFYRFNAPGEAQSNNRWSGGEHAMFMETLLRCNGKSGTEPGKCDYVWGVFSKCIPGRVGYQCSNYYRTLVKLGTVEDKNYTVDNQGVMRFNFKTGGVPSKPMKKRPPPNSKLSKQPAAKKPKVKKKAT